ncbi:dynamin-like 120 kDa protein, mitochondrial [Lingula anatina]|uniref:Dynamin-like 120 kDa protein, mitochondrial n=1 Tax=Lingula anatina TaxID=7574 RepID=A0A1S3HKE0_LINAN|nr:dynamin-like 120 kDa protein, mitochondrial [Lingula anatina]|eukprot:XP_013385931.1 dynamin-like 120 kDa protein, mitochondrial [Lingula anatina]
MLRILRGSFGPGCQACLKNHMKACADAQKTLAHKRALLTYTGLAGKNSALHFTQNHQPSGYRQTTSSLGYTRSVLLKSTLLSVGGVRHVNTKQQYKIPKVLKIGQSTVAMGRGLITLVLGTATTLIIVKTYVLWKDKVPDMGWVKPTMEKWKSNTVKSLRTASEITSRTLATMSNDAASLMVTVKNNLPGLSSLRDALENMSDKGEIGKKQHLTTSGKDLTLDTPGSISVFNAMATPTDYDKAAEKPKTEKQRLEAAQEEMMQVQLRYQKEVERLEKENRELKKQLLLLKSQKTGKKRTMKVGRA